MRATHPLDTEVRRKLGLRLQGRDVSTGFIHRLVDLLEQDLSFFVQLVGVRLQAGQCRGIQIVAKIDDLVLEASVSLG